jgi:hypothetical protein
MEVCISPIYQERSNTFIFLKFPEPTHKYLENPQDLSNQSLLNEYILASESLKISEKELPFRRFRNRNRFMETHLFAKHMDWRNKL